MVMKPLLVVRLVMRRSKWGSIECVLLQPAPDIGYCTEYLNLPEYSVLYRIFEFARIFELARIICVSRIFFFTRIIGFIQRY